MPRQIDEARVFEVTLHLWVSRGYAGTTTREIAELAGVNEATLYRRYGNKAELVVTALRQQLQNVKIRELTATNDLEADLVRIVEAYLETGRSLGSIFPWLLVEASRQPELRGALEVALENLGILRQVIEHHQARGVLQPGDPFSALIALIGPLFAVGMFRRALPDGPTVELDIANYVRDFLHGRANSRE